MNLAALLAEWDTDNTPIPPLNSNSRRTIARETAAGHQPRERACPCGRCTRDHVWSIHAVCDDCGPATCSRCQPETAYRQAVTS